ncbi:MAG: hypothetical protein NZ932_05265 [Candidatus Bathyarchaeota archaeon]|nr:hypothetical protein [Candidatus Bathyarchaeota archaeon]
MANSSSLALLACFMGLPAVVDAPAGHMKGVLLRSGGIKHRGIGNLLLETRNGWVLIKEWTAIKGRT